MHGEGVIDAEGGMQGRGHAWQGGVDRGGMHGRGQEWQGACVAGGMCGRRVGQCSGQYASYWNAFLFEIFSSQIKDDVFSLFKRY